MPDPFAVDTERALDALKLAWGDSYELAVWGGLFAARFKESGQVLSSETPDGIVKKIERDFAVRNP